MFLKLPAIGKYTVLYTYVLRYVLKEFLHESRLRYNPGRTHSVFEIIGIGLDLLHEFRLSYTTHSGLSFFRLFGIEYVHDPEFLEYSGIKTTTGRTEPRNVCVFFFACF